jgi:hypothetical protein
MPDFTIASAIPRTNSSLTLQANLFQVLNPMGGVGASPLDTALSSANIAPLSNAVKATTIGKRVFIFLCASVKHTFLTE